MSKLQEFLEAARESIRENHEQQPSLTSELAAMTREGIKDIRQTMNEVFFGQGEHAPELGTPLNPVQREVYNDRHQINDQAKEGPDLDMG